MAAKVSVNILVNNFLEQHSLFDVRLEDLVKLIVVILRVVERRRSCILNQVALEVFFSSYVFDSVWRSILFCEFDQSLAVLLNEPFWMFF